MWCSLQVPGNSPTSCQWPPEPGTSSFSSQRLVPVATAAAAAIARVNSLRDTLPLIGVSIPSAIKTSRSGSLRPGLSTRGGSPTYALMSSSTSGVPVRARPFSCGATPVSGIAGSSPRYFDNNSFGSLSSLGSATLAGLMSPSSGTGGGDRASGSGIWQQALQDGLGRDGIDPVVKQLQQRLDGVLLQVAEMVLAVGQASGQAAAVGSKAGAPDQVKAGEAGGSLPTVFASASGAAAAAVAGGSPTAAAYPGSGGLPTASSGLSFNYSYGSGLGAVSKPMSFEDVIVNLQGALDSARVAQAAAQIATSPLAALPATPAPAGVGFGSDAAISEEGVASLAEAVADVALEEAALGAKGAREGADYSSPHAAAAVAASSAAAAACIADAVMQPLPMALVRRLISLCSSAAGFLAGRSSVVGPVSSPVAAGPAAGVAAAGGGSGASTSIDALLAELQPAPVGCWNMACNYLGGACEARVALKTCPTCQVAVYCSKACEKAAWPQHKVACGQLKEQGRRLAAASGGELGADGVGKGEAGEGGKSRAGRSFDSGRTRPLSGGGPGGGLHPRISAPGSLYLGKYRS